MNKLSFKDIDQIRNQGLRPQIVGCFVNDQKILFLFKKEYDLWQLPQGGIDNKETLEQATKREMIEELGNNFISQCDKNYELIGEDTISFPPSTQGTRELINDEGKKIYMKGKEYFFMLINSRKTDLEIKETEFDDYKWLSYDEAIKLTDSIYQTGKKRITAKILNLLHDQNKI